MSSQPDPGRGQAPADEGLEEVLPEVYDELRRLAAKLMSVERQGHTLQPTALVHEVWLRLAGGGSAPVSRWQYYAAAATAMRRILINHARDRGRLKRGGDARRVALDASHLAGGGSEVDLLALDEALDELARHDPRKARLVELRYFAGLDNEACAEALGVSLATLKREWVAARAWLLHSLS